MFNVGTHHPSSRSVQNQAREQGPSTDHPCSWAVLAKKAVQDSAFSKHRPSTWVFCSQAPVETTRAVVMTRVNGWVHWINMFWTCMSIWKLDWKRTPSNLLQSSCSILSIAGGRWKHRALGRLKTISLVLARLSVRWLVNAHALTWLNSTSRVWFRRYPRGQTDTHAHHNTSQPLSRAK